MGPLTAWRATRAFPMPRPSSPAARLGLRYERKVGQELDRHVSQERFARLEHNPWFTFSDTYGTNNCCPDFLLWVNDGIVVVEVKLSWVEVALPKLQDLYIPVVSRALGVSAIPLVICRNLNSNAPVAKFSLREALVSSNKLLHWPNTGRIQW